MDRFKLNNIYLNLIIQSKIYLKKNNNLNKLTLIYKLNLLIIKFSLIFKYWNFIFVSKYDIFPFL
jgi:hypothetical protein